jgi:Alginate export
MTRGIVASCTLCLWLGLPEMISGQAVSPGAEPPVVESPASRLPGWLKLGYELRGRAESNGGFDAAHGDPAYLNRLRLNVTVQPSSWFRLYLQAQDARAFSSGADHVPDDLQNTLEPRQAYADFGRAEAGWQLRVGRQELSLGDERLLGADNYWDSFGQAFDALRVGYASTQYRVDAFTGYLVQAGRLRPDPFDRASRISGLAVQFKARGGAMIDPYVLWKRGGDTLDLLAHPGHRDVLTPGIRAQGTAPRNLEYNIEMALQRGHVVADQLSAWAGHWELGWRPLGAGTGPRLGAEYNFASGDGDPSDGTHSTFDDLYPAGFSKYGMADPIAWRNIRYPALGVELPLNRKWTIFGGYRHYWLARITDGLYPGGDQYLVRNPVATSSSVGAHLLLSAAYSHSDHWQFSGGFGCLLPGAFLKQSGYTTAIPTAFLLYSFTY